MNRETLVFSPSDLRRERLHEQVAARVEQIIAARQLQPGCQLPPERELAKQLGVNRTTIRQGLYLLQQRGLIEVKGGSGSYLTRMAPSVVAASIERYFVFGNCSHRELVTVREILEPETAALAARHATAEDLARLQTRVEQIEGAFAQADVEACAAADAGFHTDLAVASKNKLLIAFMSGLQQVMKLWLQTQIKVRASEAGLRGHRLIFDAVAARDAERARDAMRAHIHAARSYLLDWTDDDAGRAEAAGE